MISIISSLKRKQKTCDSYSLALQLGTECAVLWRIITIDYEQHC